MTAVFKREVNSFFNNFSGYVIAVFILIFAGIYVMAVHLSSGYTSYQYVLNQLCFIFIIVVPILTMRIITEDFRQKTDQLLYSLPLGMTKIVLGKYFAMLAVLALPMIFIALYPLLLSAYGHMLLKAAYGAVIAFALLGAALISIGMFISSLTDNIAVSAGLCFVVMLLLYFLNGLASFLSATALSSFTALLVIVFIAGIIIWLVSRNLLFAGVLTAAGEAAVVIAYIINADSFSGLIAGFVPVISPFERFYDFLYGVFDFNGVVYFISVIFLFLFLTVQSLEKRRWS